MPRERQLLVSILIPARPYPTDRINTALKALVENTIDKNNIEIIIKVDDDSPNTLDIIKRYENLLPIKTITMNGRWRRAGLMRYINKLASLSSGDLLWYMSDRMKISSPGWDKVLENNISLFKDKISIIYPSNEPGVIYGPAGMHAMISRKMYSLLGVLSRHNAIDMYINTIANTLPKEYVCRELKNINVAVTFERTHLEPLEESDELSWLVSLPNLEPLIRKDIDLLLREVQD